MMKKINMLKLSEFEVFRFVVEYQTTSRVAVCDHEVDGDFSQPPTTFDNPDTVKIQLN